MSYAAYLKYYFNLNLYFKSPARARTHAFDLFRIRSHADVGLPTTHQSHRITTLSTTALYRVLCNTS